MSSVIDIEDEQILVKKIAAYNGVDEVFYLEIDSRVNLSDEQVKTILKMNVRNSPYFKGFKHYARKISVRLVETVIEMTQGRSNCSRISDFICQGQQSFEETHDSFMFEDSVYRLDQEEYRLCVCEWLLREDNSFKTIMDE